MSTLSGWCTAPAGARPQHEKAQKPAPGQGSERELQGAKWDNGGSTKDGPGDSLLAQQVGFPGPRPTPVGAPN